MRAPIRNTSGSFYEALFARKEARMQEARELSRKLDALAASGRTDFAALGCSLSQSLAAGVEPSPFDLDCAERVLRSGGLS
ncbi:MAG: hypothetical protein WC322_06595 [Candidatus Paceibacterota bacterium]|jgi:hypothetical protein